MASQPLTGTPIQGQGPGQGPGQQGAAGAGERPLNVRDALSYLDQVKVRTPRSVGDGDGADSVVRRAGPILRSTRRV